MGSIHGRHPIFRNCNRRWHTPVGEQSVRLSLRRCVDGALGAAQQTPISYEHVIISHRSQPLGYRARCCASAHAEVYSDPTRAAQNRLSMQVLYIWAHLGLAQRRHYFVTESPRACFRQ